MPPTLAAVLPSIQGLTPQCEGPGGITSATSPQAFYYCDFCDLAELINNILNLLVFVGTCMAIIAFIWAGVTMVMAQGNPTKLNQGKSIFKNVFVGFVLMLAAWLIIDVVMKTLTNLDGEDPRFGPWNEVLCPDGFDPKENQAENFDAGLSIKVSEVVPGVPTGSGGGATPGTGECEPAKLSIFGARANAMSCICKHESSGNPLAGSSTGGVDGGGKTADGHSIAWGLFQINITAHKIECSNPAISLNCPAAFSNEKSYTQKRVVNTTLYTQCVKAAQNISCNTQMAKKLLDARAKSQPSNAYGDWVARNKCGL